MHMHLGEDCQSILQSTTGSKAKVVPTTEDLIGREGPFLDVGTEEEAVTESEYDPRTIEKAARHGLHVKTLKRLTPIAVAGFVVCLFVIGSLGNPDSDGARALAGLAYFMMFVCLAVFTGLFYVLCLFRP